MDFSFEPPGDGPAEPGWVSGFARFSSESSGPIFSELGSAGPLVRAEGDVREPTC
jgi:hypothetical protein